MKTKKYTKPKLSYSKKPSFSVRSKTKSGNTMVTQGWSKKGESKITKTIGYNIKTMTGRKDSKLGRRKMVITTIKKITKRNNKKL